MERVKFPTDRTSDSTDNNEFAEGYRDETFWKEDITDIEIPQDDEISGLVGESGENDRPIYDEYGYRRDLD